MRAGDKVPLQRRIVVVGLVGALAFIAAVGVYLAMINAPYQQDESVARGLRAQPAARGSAVDHDAGADRGRRRALEDRSCRARGRSSTPTSTSPTIHHSCTSPAFRSSSSRSERTSRTAPLLALRLVDLIGAVAAIAVAYLLGRELSGGDRFVGFVTAGLLSSVIAISLVSSVANIDGPALVATTGVTWMTARFARTHALRDATVLGLWCAGAAAVRPMSLAFAAVAGGMALFLGLRARGMSALVPLVTRLAAPTVLLTGWFYAWNWHRFGDVTGSYALFDDRPRVRAEPVRPAHQRRSVRRSRSPIWSPRCTGGVPGGSTAVSGTTSSPPWPSVS